MTCYTSFKVSSNALHILKDYEDARECENDTYFKAWNVMPPKKPEILQAFLGKITRNLSLDRYQMQTAQKRGGFEVTFKGEEAGYSVAVWTDGKCAYAIDAQDAPMQEDELRSMIEFLSQSME